MAHGWTTTQGELSHPSLASYSARERRAILVQKYFLGIEMNCAPGLDGGIRSWEARYGCQWRRRQHLTEARFWASNGYAVVVQDTRGKFGSNGEYVPFLNEFDDGTATLDWIVEREWSNGDVGMYATAVARERVTFRMHNTRTHAITGTLILDTGDNSGSVTCRKSCHELAPSMRAASMSCRV